jgi:Glutathione S-transferase, N-terminal domain
MRLYVCYGTFGPPDGHPCAKAHRALIDAGYRPEVIRTFGCFRTDPLFGGRREVKRMTGSYKVPVLVLDDGTIVAESGHIAEWAQANSVGSPRSAV